MAISVKLKDTNINTSINQCQLCCDCLAKPPKVLVMWALYQQLAFVSCVQSWLAYCHSLSNCLCHGHLLCCIIRFRTLGLYVSYRSSCLKGQTLFVCDDALNQNTKYINEATSWTWGPFPKNLSVHLPNVLTLFGNYLFTTLQLKQLGNSWPTLLL